MVRVLLHCCGGGWHSACEGATLLGCGHIGGIMSPTIPVSGCSSYTQRSVTLNGPSVGTVNTGHGFSAI